MKKNVIPLVIIALVVAVASTGVFYGLIVSRMDGSSGGALQPRLVAASPLEKGRVLQAGDFKLMPAADPGVPAPSRAEDLRGRTLNESLVAGRVITESVLSPLGERTVPSGIPEGMRAVTVHISDSSSVMKMVQPGDHVDVQSLLQRQRNGETDVEVRTLLQNATVFNVPGEPQGQQMQGRSVLTLLSTPQDAERLSAADAGARLRVVLRNQKDQKLVPLGSTSLLNLAAVAKPVVTSSFVPGPPKGAGAPVELEVSLIEVSPEQMLALAPEQKNGTLVVTSTTGQQDFGARIQELRSAQKAHVLASSRLVAGKSGEFSWAASDDATMRVKIEPLGVSADGNSQLRVQPETTVPQAGSKATRRVDSQVKLGRNQGVIVSGLMPSAQVSQLRERLTPGARAGGGELLMVITPIEKR